MNSRIDLVFLIATYDRPTMLHRLLKQLRAQTTAYSTRFFIINDGSLLSYGKPLRYFKRYCTGKYERTVRNHGKYYHWMIVDRLIKQLKGLDFKYAFKLDDDVQLHPQFIERCLHTFEQIQDPNKVGLNPWVDKRARRRIWTDVSPEVLDNVIRVGWVDGDWMLTPKAFEMLDWRCPPTPEHWWQSRAESSGVGRNISWSIVGNGGTLYMPKESLIFHGEHDSKMHRTMNRKRAITMEEKPWTTKNTDDSYTDHQ